MHLKDRIGVNEDFCIELKNRIETIKDLINKLRELNSISVNLKLCDNSEILQERLEHLKESIEEVLIEDIETFKAWLMHVNDELESVNRRISHEN